MRNPPFRFDRRPVGATAVLAAFFIVLGLSLAPALADHGQFYVLDGFGGVHAGGGAPAISPGTLYFGFDIAKDIAYVPTGTAGITGDGILVLDGFGGVHAGGALASVPVSPKTPYCGFDVARAITYRNIPPRASYNSIDQNNTDVTSFTNVVVASTALTLPDDGYVLILGNLSMGNISASSGAFAVARLCVGVDGTTCLDSIDREVSMEAEIDSFNFRTESVIQGAFVNSGAHTFNFLARQQAGSGTVTYFDRRSRPSTSIRTKWA